jgi:ABC-type antimicrobial peptide transport system permease subunit
VSFVTAGLLPTLGVKLVAGRLFSTEEISGGAPVAVVGEPLANAVYGSARAALGQPLVGNKKTVRIIGVTRPVRWFAHPPGQFDGTLWLPYSKLGGVSIGNVFVTVRSTLPTPVVARELDGLLAKLAPTQAFSWVRSMDTMTAQAYQGDQAPAALFAVFALLALLLATVGVYGTIAYLTRLRLGEFAIRQSLGASPARVHAEAVGQATNIALAGAALGLAGGALLARVLGDFTAVPAAQSVLIYALASVALAAVAITSAAIAARRTRRLDLLSLLRPQ